MHQDDLIKIKGQLRQQDQEIRDLTERFTDLENRVDLLVAMLCSTITEDLYPPE